MKKIGLSLGAVALGMTLLPAAGTVQAEAGGETSISSSENQSVERVFPVRVAKNKERKAKFTEALLVRIKSKKTKPNPTFKPDPPPAPVKDTYLPMDKAEKQLMAAVSPISTVSKLYSKNGDSLYVATLMPSTDPQLSARYGVVYFWHNGKRVTKLQINSQRYRDSGYIQPNGDTAILAAADSVFGIGKPGSKEIHEFIKTHIDGKKSFTKDMTFGGRPASVRVGKWDIQITFK